MVNAIKLISLLLCCMTLSGCLIACRLPQSSYSFTPSIALKNDRIKFSDYEITDDIRGVENTEKQVTFENLYITHLAVTDWDGHAQNPFKWQPLWELTSKAYRDPDALQGLVLIRGKKKSDIEYIELPEEITYGEPIDGMDIVAPPMNLRENVRYRLNMDIYGEKEGEIFYVWGHKNFILRNKNGVLEIEEPSDLDYYNRMMEQQKTLPSCSVPEKSESCGKCTAPEPQNNFGSTCTLPLCGQLCGWGCFRQKIRLRKRPLPRLPSWKNGFILCRNTSHRIQRIRRDRVQALNGF